jgi:hypothetical protein
MYEYLVETAQRWIAYKTWLVDHVGVTNDALHVHGGLLILFVTALILRKRPDSILCWLAVFIAELFNEYADIRGHAAGEATINAGLHDIYNTMFWPSIILLTGWLLFPKRIKPIAPQSVDDMSQSSDLPDQPLK